MSDLDMYLNAKRTAPEWVPEFCKTFPIELIKVERWNCGEHSHHSSAEAQRCIAFRRESYFQRTAFARATHFDVTAYVIRTDAEVRGTVIEYCASLAAS